MTPGMDEKEREEKRFAEDVDRLLGGGEVTAGGATGEDEYRSNIDFARKMIECRAEPSPAFQQALKQRLLSKLVEQDVAEGQRRAERVSFWDRVRTLVPRSPAWRVAAVTVAVAVLATVGVWRLGLLSPSEGPIVTLPGPVGPSVAVEGRAVADKASYASGERISVQLTFKNVTAGPLSMPFPPGITVVNAIEEPVKTFGGGQDIKTIAPGESVSYDLTWDQRDDAGNRVTPGDYQVRMLDIRLGEGIVASLVESPTLTVAP
jgi:hypothetical protein